MFNALDLPLNHMNSWSYSIKWPPTLEKFAQHLVSKQMVQWQMISFSETVKEK